MTTKNSFICTALCAHRILECTLLFMITLRTDVYSFILGDDFFFVFRRTIAPRSHIVLQLPVQHCKGVNYLEHVQAKLTLTSQRRGDIQIHLRSPAGTKVTLLTSRYVCARLARFSQFSMFVLFCFFGWLSSSSTSSSSFSTSLKN